MKVHSSSTTSQVDDSYSRLVEAIAFYQEQLPGLGWQPNSNPVVSATLAVQEFARENQLQAVAIRVDEHTTTLLLVLRPVLL